MDYILQTSPRGPEVVASPVPLTGVEMQDIPALVKGAPIANGRFHATFEGELFSVERRVSGDEWRIRECTRRRLNVLDYQAAALEMLIGSPLPVYKGGGVSPAMSIMVVAPMNKTQRAGQAVVVIQDTYQRAADDT